MLKNLKYYQTLIIVGLFFNNIQSMSISSVVKKLTSNHQVQPKILNQNKDFNLKTHEPFKMATKIIAMRCHAINSISNHLDNIENAQNLKQKLAETPYAQIIFDLEASFDKAIPDEAEHLLENGGQITKLAAKFVNIKSLANRLRACRNVGSLCSFFNDSYQSLFLDSSKTMTPAFNVAVKQNLLDEALTKIDQQLIKNLCYEDQIFAEPTADVIRAKLKTKLMGRQSLTEADLSLLTSEIAELINFDYINHVEKKYESRLTFPVFSFIDSASAKAAKKSSIEKEIRQYQDALKFIIANNVIILGCAQIKKNPMANEIWLSIEKKFDDQLCDEFAKSEFAKLSLQEQTMLKDKFTNSSMHQLIISNKLLSLTHKLDKWTTGNFKFSDLWTVTSNAYQLYNLQQPNKAHRLKADTNLWLTYFREQLAATY